MQRDKYWSWIWVNLSGPDKFLSHHCPQMIENVKRFMRMLICDQWLQLCFEDGDDVQCLVDSWAARNDLNRFFPQHKQVISHKKTPELRKHFGYLVSCCTQFYTHRKKINIWNFRVNGVSHVKGFASFGSCLMKTQHPVFDLQRWKKIRVGETPVLG